MKKTKQENKKTVQAMKTNKQESKPAKREEKKNAQAMETDIREGFFIACLVSADFYANEPAASCFLPRRRLFYVPACHPSNFRDMYAC
ncbi:MAG: hypothetical protein LBJ60_05010 [Tannerellaceae bacterium]|nr:hypothetical protein [Tannerellaceae bacterium]